MSCGITIHPINMLHVPSLAKGVDGSLDATQPAAGPSKMDAIKSVLGHLPDVSRFFSLYVLALFRVKPIAQ